VIVEWKEMYSIGSGGPADAVYDFVPPGTYVFRLAGVSSTSGTVAGVVGHNAEQGVTWVHSYVSEDKTKTFCVYDGPTAEAVRTAAKQTGLPVDRITPVSVLDPYFYHE